MGVQSDRANSSDMGLVTFLVLSFIMLVSMSSGLDEHDFKMPGGNLEKELMNCSGKEANFAEMKLVQEYNSCLLVVRIIKTVRGIMSVMGDGVFSWPQRKITFLWKRKIRG